MKSGNDLNLSRIALRLMALLPVVDSGCVVLVTSAGPGEGKTFVARLLAREMSRSLGLAPTLVDADPATGTATGTGAALFDAGKQMAGAGGGLFDVAGVRRGFDRLRAAARLTLVDAPVLSDCGALLLHADAVVLVVDSRRTPPAAVKGALAAVQLDAGRIAGVLLNRATPRKY